MTRAHPRSRGDHNHSRRFLHGARGSSPLARGPLVGLVCVGHVAGLIPARAGTTSRLWLLAGRGGAHPRSRGDHGCTAQENGGHGGSSPLARGPLTKTYALTEAQGLIPARAGTTSRGVSPAACFGAHPRSRGDHREPSVFLNNMRGSSPLARGPLNQLLRDFLQEGLIPARAGTTVFGMTVNLMSRAHPRSRGDHLCSERGF